LAIMFAVGAVSHFSAGAQIFECRYFTTVSVGVCMSAMTAADVFFARKWSHMTTFSIVAFGIANIGCVFAAFLIVPNSSTTEQDLSEPCEAEPLLRPSGPLGKLDVIPLTPGHQAEDVSGTWWYQAWFAFGRKIPVVILAQVPLLYGLVLFTPTFSQCSWFAFCVLTCYSVITTYIYGMHLVIFAVGGQRKVEIAQATDFRAKFEADRAERKKKDTELTNFPSARFEGQPSVSSGSRSNSMDSLELTWDDLMHVVVIANYKEDLHILREATESVAASPLAKTQICLVFAMEEREHGVRQKAETLISEWRGSFKDVFATFHPEGIPGEIAGKASNMHWATARISEYVDRLPDVTPHKTVLTVVDADSEFHPKHFCALSEAFLNAGARRDENIWQPLMLHYKNYHEQPGVLRLAGQLLAQYELAHLADPMATALPYSTYSIPLRLLQAVGDFDPDWLSEDWHIGLKCRLATSGNCYVRPIFLPVLNYAPAGDNLFKTIEARWQQAKRHALGFSEFTYVWGSIPLASAHFAASGDHCSHPSRFSRFLMQAVLPCVGKLMEVHGIVSSMFLLAPLNSYMLFHFWTTGADSCIGSWTYVIDFTVTGVNSLFHAGALLAGVFLYEQQKHRIVPHADGELFWCKSKVLHWIRLVVVEYVLFGPMFFICGGAAEWIAAVKSISSHKFTHDVASKPAFEESAAARRSLLNTEPEELLP
jgi:hypothetical protein